MIFVREGYKHHMILLPGGNNFHGGIKISLQARIKCFDSALVLRVSDIEDIRLD
jgi:hypothetical protein